METQIGSLKMISDNDTGMTFATAAHTSRLLECPAPIVCPICRNGLDFHGTSIRCRGCDRTFGFTGGFPDLIVGDRFEDATTPDKMLYEEHSNRHTTVNYWIPLFRKLWRDRPRGVRLLSLGCGVGIDVDLLADEGFECLGIDCGNRTNFWARRQRSERLLLANGMNLPFEDRTFDGVFCGCVFPHVGVVGDSFQVASGYYEDRLRLAREMSRVLRPGGKVLVSSPNRYFIFDLFHGRADGSYKPRVNRPGSRFLLSRSDYRQLFTDAGLSSIKLQKVENYWGFIRAEKSLKGRLAGIAPKAAFWLVSQPGMTWLLPSPVNPWLVVMARKAEVSA
jgi:SAM-dependent methyltransferase